MGTLNRNASSHQHDGQRNYDHSNQQNRDNIRNATRDHHYRAHDEALTNDALFDSETHEAKMPLDFEDKDQNVDQHQPEQ